MISSYAMIPFLPLIFEMYDVLWSYVYSSKEVPMSAEYYTAKEAMKMLRESRSTFYRDVEAGRIPFEIEEGKKRGKRFPKEAIDLHAQRQLQRKREAMKLTFVRSTNADLWTAVQYIRRTYGEEQSITYRRALEWLDSNNELFMSAKEGEKLVGIATLIPLEESTILSLIHNKTREKNIPDRAIKSWTDPGLSVYIARVVTIQSRHVLTDRERGRFLLSNTIKWAIALHRQYDIKHWYAVGATPQGQSMLRRLGFDEVVALEGDKRKGYVLKDTSKPTRLIRMFLKE